ncbi:MAG: MFS transporter [Methanobrevibacter sp.]
MSKDRESMKGTYFISSISTTTYLVEYGVLSIFTLFLLYVLDFSIPLTSRVYAYYYGFAYLIPVLIGYISDKYLNKTSSVTIGFVSMIISQMLLWFSASLYDPNNPVRDTIVFNLQNITCFIGLLFLALGMSFASLSITHIINSINNKSSRLKGFSIYYPILNFGILIGVIITSVVVGNENYELYEWIFFIFTIILTIGLISFRLGKDKYLVDNEGNPMKDDYSKDSIIEESNKLLRNISHESISKIKNLNFRQRRKLFRDSLTPNDKDKLTVFFIFLMIIIFYRIAFSQSSISLVFFINTYVQRDLSFFTIPVQMFSMLNPLFILILGPILIKIGDKLEKKKIKLGFIKRTILALLIMVLCFTLLTVIGYYMDIDSVDKISLIWIVVFEFFIAASELLFSIAGYAMVGDLAPEKYYSLFFGFFLATKSVAMFLSGFISSLFPPEGCVSFMFNIPINGLMTFFITFVIMNLFTALFLIIYRKKLVEKMHLEDLNSA